MAHRTVTSGAAAFVTALAALCCLALLTPSAAWVTAHRHSLGVPQNATHHAGMHIVVAMYQEDINDVQQYLEKLLSIHSVAATHPRIFLYIKGGPEFVAQARERNIAHDVVELPNIGREQETYLRHIVAHYDSLPPHVFFTQAVPNYEDILMGRLQTLFGPRTGVLGLGLVAVCTCEGHSEIWPEYGPGGFIRLREVWALAQGTLCPHRFACFHNGFLIASRARLRLQTKEAYEYLLGLFTTRTDSPLRWYETIYHHAVSDVPEEWPTWGHVMERSWNALLSCTDEVVADSCNVPCEQPDCTALERCQCVDEGTPPARVAPI